MFRRRVATTLLAALLAPVLLLAMPYGAEATVAASDWVMSSQTGESGVGGGPGDHINCEFPARWLLNNDPTQATLRVGAGECVGSSLHADPGASLTFHGFLVDSGATECSYSATFDPDDTSAWYDPFEHLQFSFDITPNMDIVCSISEWTLCTADDTGDQPCAYGDIDLGTWQDVDLMPDGPGECFVNFVGWSYETSYHFNSVVGGDRWHLRLWLDLYVPEDRTVWVDWQSSWSFPGNVPYAGGANALRSNKTQVALTEGFNHVKVPYLYTDAASPPTAAADGWAPTTTGGQGAASPYTVANDWRAVTLASSAVGPTGFGGGSAENDFRGGGSPGWSAVNPYPWDVGQDGTAEDGDCTWGLGHTGTPTAAYTDTSSDPDSDPPPTDAGGSTDGSDAETDAECEFSLTDPGSWLEGGMCAVVGLLRRALGFLRGILNAVGRLAGSIATAIGNILEDLFVPSDGYLTDQADDLNDAWDGSAPGAVIGGAGNVIGTVGGMSIPAGGCDGIALPEIPQVGLTEETHLFSSCDGWMSTAAGFIRPFLIVMLYLGAIFASARILGAAIGLNLSIGKGGD